MGPAKRKRRGRKTYTKAPERTAESESAAAGQAGDLQGLSGEPTADSESVRELVEEGQSFEAGVISGIENAPPADAGEVKTREVPEDDVPPEYVEQQDKDVPKE